MGWWGRFRGYDDVRIDDETQMLYIIIRKIGKEGIHHLRDWREDFVVERDEGVGFWDIERELTKKVSTDLV